MGRRPLLPPPSLVNVAKGSAVDIRERGNAKRPPEYGRLAGDSRLQLEFRGDYSSRAPSLDQIRRKISRVDPVMPIRSILQKIEVLE